MLCIRKALKLCMSDKLLDLLQTHTSHVKAWVLEFKPYHHKRSSPYIHIPKSFMTVTSWEPGIYHYRHVYKTEPKSKAEKEKSISYWLNIFWSQSRDE